MAQQLGDGKKEQDIARMQRKELKEELADNYARLPRRPRNRRRIIAFAVLGVVAVLAVRGERAIGSQLQDLVRVRVSDIQAPRATYRHTIGGIQLSLDSRCSFLRHWALRNRSGAETPLSRNRGDRSA